MDTNAPQNGLHAPFAPSHDMAVARATALAEELRGRVAEGDGLRRLPDESVAALRRSGLLRVLQARRHGGWQLPLRTHLDVVAAIGRGCASTAWCLGVIHAHSWLMALFPPAAQDETYGADPDAIIAAAISPRGRARPVAGGYVLNGVWPFGSGSQHAQWVFLGAFVENEAGDIVDDADLLVPVADITFKDDWHVTGLRGTGSCTMVAQDAFVPAHRYLSLRAAIGGDTPGAGLHEGGLYRSAAVPVLSLALTPCALGIARAGLEAFKARLPGREVAYTQREIQRDMPVTHIQAAQAATRIDAAEAVLYRCADDITAAAERGEMLGLEKRARVRMDCAWAVRQCLDAVELLYLASGGSGIAEGSPLGRAWRDLHAVNMHGLLNLETNLEMYGRIVLGLPQNTPLI